MCSMNTSRECLVKPSKNGLDERSYILQRAQTMDQGDNLKNCPKFASFNYINSIIGSGVIGIPYAFNLSGVGLGVILLIIVAIITDYSLVLMLRSAHISGSFSYQSLMKCAFGKCGYIVLSFLQFTYPFIAMISYNIIVGDTATKVLVRLFSLPLDSIFAQRYFVIAMATIFITTPLCMLRNVARLAKASIVSFIMVLIIFGTIVIKYESLYEVMSKTANVGDISTWDFARPGAIQAVGIMSFGFMCHHNVFLLYDSIQGASQNIWNWVTHFAVTISVSMMIAFGLVGYATFGDLTQGDLLENYCWNDDLINISRLLFSLITLLTFPLECMVTKAVVDQTLRGGTDPMPIPMTKKRHAIITLSILLITYLVSISTNCLGIALELNGVIAAIPLAFVLPAAIYIKLSDEHWTNKIPAYCLALFGAILAASGVTLVIYEILFTNTDSCENAHIMEYCKFNTSYRQIGDFFELPLN
ncbi:putative sodium-coupled neutral amino acid transporter 11 [Daktulosphaira vitifoliae]|uniref:putative sodium-coupled neutral amino acid transporter 11 n=1 Tax=Daktulosphaira vitifoliae TaxID=58002 RepID=UPI0021AAD1D2|nr:putative sodium-coupled neutral amino acid transporter 11 [Daktulosphaira vitifoliae]